MENNKRFVPQRNEIIRNWWHIKDVILNCCIQFENGDIFGCKTEEDAQKVCDFLNNMWLW